jgi:hypothetical protein
VIVEALELLDRGFCLVETLKAVGVYKEIRLLSNSRSITLLSMDIRLKEDQLHIPVGNVCCPAVITQILRDGRDTVGGGLRSVAGGQERLDL